MTANPLLSNQYIYHRLGTHSPRSRHTKRSILGIRLPWRYLLSVRRRLRFRFWNPLCR